MSMTGLRILAAAATIAVCPAKAVKFETVSVTVNHSDNRGYSGHLEVKPGEPVKLTFQNVSLKFCLQQAYSMKEYQISGPAWIRTARYDIVATLPAGSAPEQAWSALQELLAERWKMSVRREMKATSIYALTVAGNGPKLHPATGTRPGPMRFQPGERLRSGGNASGSLQLDQATLSDFCDNLSRNLNRPVIDATGLPGSFDFQLEYGSDSIAGALKKQLGLQLEPRNGEIERLIVESALRKPLSQ